MTRTSANPARKDPTKSLGMLAQAFGKPAVSTARHGTRTLGLGFSAGPGKICCRNKRQQEEPPVRLEAGSQLNSQGKWLGVGGTFLWDFAYLCWNLTRMLNGRISVHICLIYSKQSCLESCLPTSRQPRGFSWSAGRIEYCSSWLMRTLYIVTITPAQTTFGVWPPFKLIYLATPKPICHR